MTSIPYSHLPIDLAKRIDAAVSGETSMSPDALAVLDQLADRPACRTSPVSIASMQQFWKWCGCRVLTDRQVKAAVKELLEVHRIPIGSSKVPGSNGYYFILTEEDRQQAETSLIADIISLAARLKVINPKSAYARLLQGQIVLEDRN